MRTSPSQMSDVTLPPQTIAPSRFEVDHVALEVTSTVTPSVYVATALSWTAVNHRSVTDPGVVESETSCAGVDPTGRRPRSRVRASVG